MEELTKRLEAVEDSYFAFVAGVVAYARTSEEHVHLIIEFLDQNPDALSSEVLEFVASQPDFISQPVNEATA